ncbi:unnamed protein product [Arabis nemorensis]|uniref:Uncharacterized protein n=1 Tax=Arabis nemorensis TaxID=586526 RepID=A0A565ALD5_9BRAS|nr:unnamed protein product [Arabis nemorensis]
MGKRRLEHVHWSQPLIGFFPKAAASLSVRVISMEKQRKVTLDLARQLVNDKIRLLSDYVCFSPTTTEILEEIKTTVDALTSQGLSRVEGRYRWEFAHEYFVKGRPDLLVKISNAGGIRMWLHTSPSTLRRFLKSQQDL